MPAPAAAPVRRNRGRGNGPFDVEDRVARPVGTVEGPSEEPSRR